MVARGAYGGQPGDGRGGSSMSETGKFTGKVAIVTASGRGMGKAVATRLAREGAKVVICARTLVYGQETVRELRDAGCDARLFALDVTHRQAITELIAFTEREFSRLDIVVHCAADFPFARLVELSDAGLEQCLTSILKSSFWLIKDAVPLLKKSGRGGRFVFISSTCGPRYAIPGLVHYGTAKAGLNALVRGAALELAPDGINVTGIEPGLIASDKMKSSMSPAHAEAIAAQLPIPRAGSVAEIAGLVSYLLSDEAAYINGATIVMDGGASLANPIDVSKVLAEHGKGHG
jgi:3-oxoacyl-[acyl-carrier protein] reductase